MIYEPISLWSDAVEWHSNKPEEPLIPHDIPPKQWDTLGSDLFFWNNASYLLVSDYYSKFPLVRKLVNLRSETTIAHFKSIFEEFGIPSKLITGNDTQFTAASFQDFSKKYGFTHVTTSPYYPQANGFIERTVQTVKNIFQVQRIWLWPSSSHAMSA